MTAEISYYGELFAGSSDKITPAIQKAANTAKTYGLALVKARTPVDTGELKNAWSATVEGKGIKWVNNQPYAGYVELGTRKMKPRFMLTDSLVDINLVFEEQLNKEIGKAIGSKVVSDLVATPAQPNIGNTSDNKTRKGGLGTKGFAARSQLSKSQQNSIKQARPAWQAKPYRPGQVGTSPK